MPARRLSMRKLREVLRLRYELKLGYQQIGRSCAIAVSTVHKYLKRAEKVGLRWPLPEDWGEGAAGNRAVSGKLHAPSAQRGAHVAGLCNDPPGTAKQ